MSKKLLPSALIEQVEHLFEFSSPAAYRKSVLTVYLEYIIKEHEMLPVDFKQIACDITVLVEFLDKAQELMSGDPSRTSPRFVSPRIEGVE